jgi:hypothetical protein
VSIGGLNPDLLRILSRELSPILEEHGKVLKITPRPGLSEDQKRVLHQEQNNFDELFPDIISMARNKYNSPEPSNRLLSILDDVSQLDEFLEVAQLDRAVNLHNAEDLIVQALSEVPEAKVFLEKILGALIQNELKQRYYNTAYAILDICREFGLEEPVCASKLDKAIEKQIAA